MCEKEFQWIHQYPKKQTHKRETVHISNQSKSKECRVRGRGRGRGRVMVSVGLGWQERTLPFASCGCNLLTQGNTPRLVGAV